MTSVSASDRRRVILAPDCEVSWPSLSAGFVYDGDGKRVKSTIGGVATYFVGNYYEVSGSTVTKYYYAGSSRIAMRAGSAVYYLLADQLGSTSITTDASGVKVAELRYTAWGEIRYSDGATPTAYRYTGQYSHAAEFGLLFYNARWLDPYLNRWTQPDSIVPDPYNPQAWDRYSYNFNNPTRYADPSGHKPRWASNKYSCNLDGGDLKKLIQDKSNELAQFISRGLIDDLEAFARLADYAGSLTPHCASCFVANLGSVITGHEGGASIAEEIMIVAGSMERSNYYQHAAKFGQSGFADIFQDPPEALTHGGGNQAFHFWFYVQATFESGDLAGYTGVVAHETVLGNPAGKSVRDLYLGFEGVKLGGLLRSGTVSPTEVGDYIRRTLSPGSETAMQYQQAYQGIIDFMNHPAGPPYIP